MNSTPARLSKRYEPTFHLADYEAYKKGLGLKEATVRVALFQLKRFDQWLKAKRRRDLRQVGLREIEAYLEGLERAGKAQATVYGHALEIRTFFAFLKVHGYLLTDPAEDLDSLRYQGKDNLRGIFTHEEISAFLDDFDVESQLALRAFFELMYSSALRLSECLGLTMADLDLRERTVLVRSGKGGKDRYLPFSLAALVFLQKYLDETRPELAKAVPAADRERVFLRKKGALTKAVVWKAFAAALEKAGLEKGNHGPAYPRSGGDLEAGF